MRGKTYVRVTYNDFVGLTLCMEKRRSFMVAWEWLVGIEQVSVMHEQKAMTNYDIDEY